MFLLEYRSSSSLLRGGQKDLSQNLTKGADAFFGRNIYFYESKAGEKAVQRNEWLSLDIIMALGEKLFCPFF